MASADPTLTGPEDGRTVMYAGGSSAELNTQRKQTGGQWAAVEWCVQAGDEISLNARERDCVRPLIPDRAIRRRSAGPIEGVSTAQCGRACHAARCAVTPPGLVTRAPAGAEYLLVPRNESDRDPAKFELGHPAERPRGQGRDRA